MRFFSEYEHRVNAKHQVTVPARFRAGGNGVFHLVAGRGGCIYMYTDEAMEEIAERIQADAAASDPAFMRMLYSRVKTVECDPAGRIVLPAEMRRHAGVEDAVVFVGVARRIELWSPARWNEYKRGHEAEFTARFDAIVEDVFERQR